MLSLPARQVKAPPRRRDLELADVFRQHGHLLSAVRPQQARVMHDVTRCRTAALGGHARKCGTCGYVEQSYNSCRNRHCPKCQSLQKARWLEARMADLLPVHYFHVVFTLPRVLNALILWNPRILYGILFRAAAEALREVAANPMHLGARIGFTAILHTWSQTLLDHPHLHCVVPGGGLSPDRRRWIACRKDFFLPVRILSVVFRGKFLGYTEQAFRDGALTLPGRTEHSRDPATFRSLLRSACQSPWVVYAKRPFAGPSHVLEYLGRYTHRVAISNDRLVDMKDGEVSFTWKDYHHDSVRKTMTLRAEEFLRRFLLHVLPRGFMRIRHYGFLGNPVHAEMTALIKRLLGVPPPNDKEASPAVNDTWQQLMLRITGIDPTVCPRCRKGQMIEYQVLEPCGPTHRILETRGRSP